MRIVAVTWNDNPCKLLSAESPEFTYEFTMPDEDVALAVETEPIEPEYHSIRVVPSDFCEIEVADKAKTGETVSLTVTVLDGMFKVVSVVYNDNQCTYVSESDTRYVYEFTMPGEDVALKAETDLDLHLITREQGEHTTLAVLNCIYNYGTPEEVVQAYMGQLVRYTVSVDIGYELSHTVVSESGREITPHYAPNDPEYGPCWRAQMPDEPITIRTAATEKTDYAGKYFTGVYTGIEFSTPANRIISGSNRPLTMNLKENTAFEVTSTDANSYSFDGCYVYDEASDSFTYIRETCNKTYGLEGIHRDGDMFIEIPNIIDNKPDYSRYYYTSKTGFDYTCASDEYKQKFLLEIRKGGLTTYYYAEPQYSKFDRAEVRFDEGSSLSGPSSALVSVGGTPLLRYTLESAGGSPVFTYKGKEAGIYAPQSGYGPSLTLDGFGRGTVGDTEGTYSVLGGIVTFATEGGTTKYLIDPINLTYYEVKSDAPWDGAQHYYGESQYGYNSDVSSNEWVKGWVHVYMDKDAMGNDKPRYAAVKMYLPDRFGQQESIISDYVPYIYDPAARTLVLSQVAQGKGDGWGQERRDISFTVSDDGRAITFVNDYVYSMGTPNKYIYTLGLVLTPAEE